MCLRDGVKGSERLGDGEGDRRRGRKWVVT